MYYNLRDKIFNWLIVKLVKHTHLYNSSVFAVIAKVPYKEMSRWVEKWHKCEQNNLEYEKKSSSNRENA